MLFRSTHLIAPKYLRQDDFEGFFQDRKAALLNLVEMAMGKQAIMTSEPVAEDGTDSEDDS